MYELDRSLSDPALFIGGKNDIENESDKKNIFKNKKNKKKDKKKNKENKLNISFERERERERDRTDSKEETGLEHGKATQDSDSIDFSRFLLLLWHVQPNYT